MASVCRVGSVEMPSFIFFASLLIIGFFVFTSVMLYRQTTKLARAVTLAIEALQGFSGGELTALRDAMSRSEETRELWERFEPTLIQRRSGKATEVFAPEAVDLAFSREKLVDSHLSTAFFNSVPGVLTGVGLLMTFVAILDGLSHVTVAANMDVKGIGGLINGLSGKFVSSIVAVSCAVAFVFVERFTYSRPLKAHRLLVRLLSSRFRRLTDEHLLFELQEEIRALRGGNPAPERLERRG